MCKHEGSAVCNENIHVTQSEMQVEFRACKSTAHCDVHASAGKVHFENPTPIRFQSKCGKKGDNGGGVDFTLNTHVLRFFFLACVAARSLSPGHAFHIPSHNCNPSLR